MKKRFAVIFINLFLAILIVTVVILPVFVVAQPVWQTPTAVSSQSSEASGKEASRSIDDNTGTEWEEPFGGSDVDGTYEWYITYDMGDTYNIEKIRIYADANAPGGPPCKVEIIKVCDDAACDTESDLLASTCNLGTTLTWHECDNTDASGRYIYVEGGHYNPVGGPCVDKTGFNLYDFWEFDAYAGSLTPTVTLVSPSDINATVNRNWTYVNATSSLAADTCLLEWNTSTNITMTNASDTNWYYNQSDDYSFNYTYIVYCNGSDSGLWGNTATVWVKFNDTTLPTANLEVPADNNITYGAPLTANITFECNGTDNYDLDNVTLYHNISGSWASNYTASGSGINTTIELSYTIYNIAIGTYVWNCLAVDKNGNEDWATNFTFQIKDQYELTITNPTTASPKAVNASDNITITVLYLDNGANVTSGATPDNVTIDGNFSDIIWNYNCSGTLACSGLAQESCESCAHCNFTAQNCTGTPTDCAEYNASQSNCEGSGCTWNVGSQEWTTVFWDGFEDNNEWTNWTESDGTAWIITNEGACAIESVACYGTYCACAENDGDGVSLNLTVPLDLTGYTNAMLYWEQWVDNGFSAGTDNFSVYVRNGSDLWTQIAIDETGNDAWTAKSYNITAGIGLGSSFQIKFTLKSGVFDEVMFDNVNVSAASAPPPYCDGTPNPCSTHINNETNCTTYGCSFTNESCDILGSGSCGVCNSENCSDCSDAGCSWTPSTQQWAWVSNSGWQLNITVPSGSTGLVDLFMNATYNSVTRDDTQIEAIDYGVVPPPTIPKLKKFVISTFPTIGGRRIIITG